MTRAAILFAVMSVSACTPDPAGFVPAIVESAMEEAARTAPANSLCVERGIGPWQPAAEARRHDPPVPPGFERLYAAPTFRGGGTIEGVTVGGVAVRGGPGCFELRGPIVDGDRAMIEVHLPGVGWNVWMRRAVGKWQVVMTTTSRYPK